MNANHISLRGLQSSYQPHSRIVGHVDWQLTPPAQNISLRLFWMVSGAAPTQVGVVETATIASPAPAGTYYFEFSLPAGPWSFQGSLLGLGWAMEAIALPSKQKASAFFTVSPTKQVIDPYGGKPSE